MQLGIAAPLVFPFVSKIPPLSYNYILLGQTFSFFFFAKSFYVLSVAPEMGSLAFTLSGQ